jgi:Flp pilus assembly protein TadG
MNGSTPEMRRALSRFAAAQDGSLTVFALLLFLLMVMMGGLAVDLMRYEATRTTLQNTLDRATLAAASLTQELDGEAVVNDYFAKAGMSQFLNGVTVSQGMNYREVKARASADTFPFFTHLIGVNEMDAAGQSTAEQRVNNVEIMLVLDVSGSMLSNSRIDNLKIAAKDFVDSVMLSDAENRISIGIVPFNGQVNLGPTLRSNFNAQDNPGVTNANCFDLAADVYDGPGISQVDPMRMTANADTYSTSNNTTSYVAYTDTSYGRPNGLNVWCPPKAGNQITMPLQDIGTLKAAIQALDPIGATSINAGIKWGLGLMDPSAQNIYTGYIGAGTMPSSLSGRPFEYTDPEAMKVIVLMTDGEHFAEERVQTAYKSGLSPIYKSNVDGLYSIYHDSKAGTSKYWVPHLGTWRAAAWTKSDNTGAATQQTWPAVWAEMRLSYVSWQFYARALGTTSSSRNTVYANQMDIFRAKTPTGTMDTQLQNICGQAKARGVIVYGIAFEAPSGGQTQIKNCSTSQAHYFNASGLQIKTAFKAIASNISQLRLTQ